MVITMETKEKTSGKTKPKNRQERINEYEKKIAEYRNRLKSEKAKESKQTRKKRTRRLIQIGAIIEKYCGEIANLEALEGMLSKSIVIVHGLQKGQEKPQENPNEQKKTEEQGTPNEQKKPQENNSLNDYLKGTYTQNMQKERNSNEQKKPKEQGKPEEEKRCPKCLGKLVKYIDNTTGREYVACIDVDCDYRED